MHKKKHYVFVVSGKFSKITITAANFCWRYYTSYKSLIYSKKNRMNYLITSHVIWEIKWRSFFPGTASQPVESRAFENWKFARVKNCFKKRQNLFAIFLKNQNAKNGSSTQIIANYVPKFCVVQRMGKTRFEQLMTSNKNDFFIFVGKNSVSGTRHTSTMIDVDSPKDYFANKGKSLASGSIFSKLAKMIILKPIDKKINLIWQMQRNIII